MATINDLKNRFQTAVSSNSYFATFNFDDIEAINEDSKSTYPLLHLKIPSKTSPLRSNSGQWENFSIEVYACDLYYQGDVDDWGEKWEELEEALKDLVYDNIPTTGIQIPPDTFTFEYGHNQHNDDLMIVRLTGTILVHDCYGA